MATFTDVFERTEVKYRLDSVQYQAMRALLEGRMVPDAYGRTRISSLYFDTADRRLIDRSLEKPLYKEKLRLRWYGAPHEDDRVFIEIKKKYEGVVYKRRVGCSYAAARAHLGGLPYRRACERYPLSDELMNEEATTARSLQIAREIDFFLRRYRPLRPSMLITCDRTAYVPAGQAGFGEGLDAAGIDVDLRITFDERIGYRDVLESRSSRTCGLIAPGEAVMEVKASGPFPLWLVHALDECRAYPTSYSKYGEAYRACATQGRGRHAFALVAKHEANGGKPC